MTATHQQALQAAHALGLDRLDAQLLLLHALGRPDSDRAWLLAHDDDPLPQPAADVLRRLSLRRAAGEPLAYIVGYKDFFGLRFAVDSRVLVPRPDTETLVQWVLDAAEKAMAETTRILDLGTGSGAIAVAVAATLSQNRLAGLTAATAYAVDAVDASAAALAVAAENAKNLQANVQHVQSVQFIQSNWFDNVSGCYHVIASNPPYIASADPHLGALTHEPQEALTAGPDGLDDLYLIIEQAPAHLLAGGWLLLEHGYDQADAVRARLTQRGFTQVQSRPDLAGIARCSGGQWLPAKTADK
ncbi:MAG: peptide chain release factor N(5)-glutamine methyltransferase [Polaromonas sp.]|nr:MAG: peptide chain release factor N(5)-glutamine methyltransferase [Polaromonas sp.]